MLSAYCTIFFGEIKVIINLQLRFDCDSTAIRPPFDSHSTAIQPRYDHSTTYVTTVDLPVCGLLHCTEA